MRLSDRQEALFTFYLHFLVQHFKLILFFQDFSDFWFVLKKWIFLQAIPFGSFTTFNKQLANFSFFYKLGINLKLFSLEKCLKNIKTYIRNFFNDKKSTRQIVLLLGKIKMLLFNCLFFFSTFTSLRYNHLNVSITASVQLHFSTLLLIFFFILPQIAEFFYFFFFFSFLYQLSG